MADDRRPHLPRKGPRTPPTIDLTPEASTTAPNTQPAGEPTNPAADAPPEPAAAAKNVDTSTKIVDPGEAPADATAADDQHPVSPETTPPHQATDPSPDEPVNPAGTAGDLGADKQTSRPPAVAVPALAGAIAGAVVAGLIAVILAPQPAIPPAVEQRLAAIEAANAGRVQASDLQSLESRLSAQPRGSNGTAETAALADRVARLEAAPAPAAQAAAPAQPSPQVVERLNRLEQAITAPNPAIAETRASVEAVTRRLAQAEAQLKSAAAGQSAAMLVVASRLNDALAAGRPIKADIDALAALGVAQGDLAPLRAVENGAPTNAALAQDFAALAAVRPAASGDNATGGILDRVMSSAAALVRVERVEEGETSLAAAEPRMDRALRTGRLAEAKALWERLPPEARQPSAAWAERLDARLAAEKAVTTLSDNAVTALGAVAR